MFLAVTELTAIQNALNTMASLLQGCVTFKSRTNEKDYISIQKGHGYGYKNIIVRTQVVPIKTIKDK